MIDIEILKDIFKNHKIKKAIMIDDSNSLNFIICSMEGSIDFNKWSNLENLLKHYTKKEVFLNSYPQAIKYLGDDYLNKGVIIGE